MLDLSLFRNTTYTGANVAMLLVTLAMFGIFFYNSIFIQRIMGYSPVQTGAIFLPMTVLIILVAPQAGKLTDRIGARWLIGTGLSFVTLSLILFAQLEPDSTFWDILPGLLTGGFGMALTMTPTTAAAMGSVPVDKAGVGSAVLNAFRQVGGSLGIAIMGAVVASQIAAPVGTPAYRAQFVDGYHLGLYVAAAIAFSGAIVAMALVRKVRHVEPAEAEVAAA
jgi:MFS family permease